MRHPGADHGTPLSTQSTRFPLFYFLSLPTDDILSREINTKLGSGEVFVDKTVRGRAQTERARRRNKKARDFMHPFIQKSTLLLGVMLTFTIRLREGVGVADVDCDCSNDDEGDEE